MNNPQTSLERYEFPHRGDMSRSAFDGHFNSGMRAMSFARAFRRVHLPRESNAYELVKNRWRRTGDKRILNRTEYANLK